MRITIDLEPDDETLKQIVKAAENIGRNLDQTASIMLYQRATLFFDGWELQDESLFRIFAVISTLNQKGKQKVLQFLGETFTERVQGEGERREIPIERDLDD